VDRTVAGFSPKQWEVRNKKQKTNNIGNIL